MTFEIVLSRDPARQRLHHPLRALSALYKLQPPFLPKRKSYRSSDRPWVCGAEFVSGVYPICGPWWVSELEHWKVRVCHKRSLWLRLRHQLATTVRTPPTMAGFVSISQGGVVCRPLCCSLCRTQCCMSFMTPPVPPFCASIFTLST